MASGGERRRVTGADVRAALLADAKDASTSLVLRRCDIIGPVDLSNTSIGGQLAFDECTFDAPLALDGADLRALSLTNCTVPGIIGNGLRMRGDFVLDRCTVAGALTTLGSTHHTAAIWLCEGDIGGRLLIRSSTIDGEGGRSLHADRLRIGGNFRFLNGSHAVGEIRLLSTRIAGSLDIVASVIVAENETALELAEAQLGGSIFITNDERYPIATTVDGIIVLSDVKVGALLRIKGATLKGRVARGRGPFDRLARHAKRIAIAAPRCEIGDDLVIDGDCTIDGALLWTYANVLGDVVLNDLTVSNPNDRSIDLGGASVKGAVIARRMTSLGTTWLAGANIGASLALEGSTFSDANGKAVVLATGIAIAGELQLDDVVVRGGSMRFRAARIGGEIDAQRATFDNPGSDTLSLSHATVGGAVRLTDVTSKGLLAINRATIGGRLRLTAARLHCDQTWERNPRGDALEIISSDIRGGMYLDWASVEPSVDLFSTVTTIVGDDIATWPARADLSGFVYERFDIAGDHGRMPWDVKHRLDILASQTPFDLAPYEHAAQVYRSHGRFSDAETILAAGRRCAVRDEVAAMRAPGSSRARRAKAVFLQYGGRLYDVSVRFGYRPVRAVALIAALVVAVALSLAPFTSRDEVMRATGASSTVYSPAGPLTGDGARCGDGDVRCFRSLIYSVETVLPLVDLGQRGTWHVESTTRYGPIYDAWLTFATLAGWGLSTVFLLSFSRIGRSASMSN